MPTSLVQTGWHSGNAVSTIAERDSLMSEMHLNCVLLADGHTGLAGAVHELLEPAFATVVMVADGAALLEVATRLQPEVAVVDLNLTHNRALDWVRAVRERLPEVKVVVVSDYDEPSVRSAAMEAGAHAYVNKLALVTDLLPTIASVCSVGPPAMGVGPERF